MLLFKYNNNVFKISSHKHIKQIISSINTQYPTKYLYIYNGKLINNDINNNHNIFGISSSDKYEIFDIFEIIPRIKGGSIGGDIKDAVLSALDEPVSYILKPIKIIRDVCMFVLKLIIWLVKMVIWIVLFMMWFVKDVLIKLPTEFVDTILLITSSILLVIPQFFVGISKYITNTFGKYVFQGFWGWDKVPANETDMRESKFLRNISGNKKDSNYKCYVGSNGEIPFSVIVGTILMPPIGIFMTMGLTGWIHILITTLLTLLFYFPGLIYALLIIYC